MKTSSIIFAGLCAAAFLPTASLACAPVPGEGRFVRVASEEAIIIWDEGAQREHFIRRASFDTDAKDFGFLVPTPSRPEIAEADERAFETLATITGQESVTARPAAVTLLEQKVVGGLRAAVLEATDAKALEGWLQQNGYPTSPELVEWVAPYIAGKWKITAFKVAGDSPKVTSAAVRMSFQTEKPFFPYREPAMRGGAKPGERLLRVYFLADARFGGKEAWTAQPVWSNTIEKDKLAGLLKLARLPALAGGGGRWLTQFEDRSHPRPGTDDVYFARAADQSTVARPVVSTIATIAKDDTYRYIAAAAVGVLALVIVVFAYRRRRRERRLFGGLS